MTPLTSINPHAAPDADEQALLDDLCAGQAARLVARTRTRVDVGTWLRRGRVLVAMLNSDMLLLAAGRRPFSLRIPCAELHDSLYNHVTGSLVLAPAPGAALTCLRMPPEPARQLLALINGDSSHHA